MESVSYIMEDQKTTFAGELKPQMNTENYSPQVENRNFPNVQEGVFSPLAPAFQGRGGNELLNLLAQQEPRTADTAPTSTDMDDVMLNFRINNPEMFLDELDNGSNNNYYMGGHRSESVSSSNLWTDNSGSASGARNGEMIDTFDFLVKSLSSANNYVSMLTREQLSVLRSIRPSLLYEFLQEVAKVRSDRRMRRALPNECAFCKNNGENEECYSTHALKDWRGRVLCPVLRAFRCPRCGATGERAHTIKYCPENADAGSERLSSRRRMPPSESLMVNSTNVQGMPPIGTRTPTSCPSTPAANAPSPSPSLHSLWSTFGIN